MNFTPSNLVQPKLYNFPTSVKNPRVIYDKSYPESLRITVFQNPENFSQSCIIHVFHWEILHVYNKAKRAIRILLLITYWYQLIHLESYIFKQTRIIAMINIMKLWIQDNNWSPAKSLWSSTILSRPADDSIKIALSSGDMLSTSYLCLQSQYVLKASRASCTLTWAFKNLRRVSSSTQKSFPFWISIQFLVVKFLQFFKVSRLIGWSLHLVFEV